MPFIIENLRFKELAIVAAQNRGAYDDFVGFLKTQGYLSLHSFIIDADDKKAAATITSYLRRALPQGVALYDGIARPYAPDKAKWLLLGWILRDAPEQRLRPMVASMPGTSVIEKQAYLFNELRKHVGAVFPEAERWSWLVVCEVIIDRLEGSRRAIKGTLFEVIVRRNLTDMFKQNGLKLGVSDVEIKLGGETYDVRIDGKKGQILLPVKTRETMGGGHALLFTRDIHKSISVAQDGGFACIPIIIAESWTGDLKALACDDHIYINRNPNQIAEVEPMLRAELERRLPAFKALM